MRLSTLPCLLAQSDPSNGHEQQIVPPFEDIRPVDHFARGGDDIPRIGEVLFATGCTRPAELCHQRVFDRRDPSGTPFPIDLHSPPKSFLISRSLSPNSSIDGELLPARLGCHFAVVAGDTFLETKLRINLARFVDIRWRLFEPHRPELNQIEFTIVGVLRSNGRSQKSWSKATRRACRGFYALVCDRVDCFERNFRYVHGSWTQCGESLTSSRSIAVSVLRRCSRWKQKRLMPLSARRTASSNRRRLSPHSRREFGRIKRGERLISSQSVYGP